MTVVKAVVAENSAAVILARVVDADGDPIAAADVASIAVKVFDRDAASPTTPTHTAAPDPGDVVYDELQVDARWSADATGYNLAVGLPGSSFPTGDHRYRAEVKITPADGDPYYVLADLSALEVLSE